MSFYYRKAGKPAHMSRVMMRGLTGFALAAYPAGAILQLVMPDAPEPGLFLAEIAGLGLIVLALMALALIAPSSLQRIVGEQTKHLDEFELELRRRANALAYQIFSVLTLLALFYFGVASDSERLNLWMPSGFDHWNAIMWGAILYAFILPTAVLAWIAPAPVCEED
ncbi:MAG: hypothetical protein RIA71_06065 [Oceanicaulis sp.]